MSDVSIRQQKQDNIIARCRRSLPMWGDMVMKHELEDYGPGCKIHDDFSHALLVEDHNCAILWPREYGKTTSAWLLAPTWNAVFNKFQNMFFIGESERKAQNQFRGARDIIRTNPFIREFYTEIITDRSDEMQIRHVSGAIIRMKCRGAGSSLRGEMEKGGRPDFIVCDDLTTTEQSRSSDALDQQVDWFWSDVMHLGKHAHVIVIGTHLGEKCLAVQLATQPPKGDITKGVRPWKGFKYGIMDEDGNPTWEERYPMAYIEEKKRQMMAQGKLDKFYQELMNIGVGSGTRLFDIEDIVVYSPRQLEAVKNELKIITVVDPAQSEGESSKKNNRDFNTIATVGVDTKGVNWILDVTQSRERLSHIAKLVEDVWIAYRPQSLYIEKLGGGVALLQTIEDRSMNGGIYLRPEFIDTKITYAGKHPRIQALDPLFSQGRIMLPASAPWIRKLEDEMMMYPKAKHDDILDAIAYCVKLSIKPIAGNFSYEDLAGCSSAVM